MQAQSLSLEEKAQGPLPLVHHFLQALDLPALLSLHVHPAHYVQGLVVLIQSVLCRPNALYRIGEWIGAYDPALRPAQPLADDALGRALDRLFECDRASLMTALVVRAIKAFHLQTHQIHNDSTSVKFCGLYAHQHPQAVKLCRGFSKDHRPDLKQLLYTLSVSADGAVPVHYKTYDGNQTDDGTHLETWRTLGQILGHHTFLYVADCKLCASATLLQLDKEGGRFVTVLPRVRAEVAEFAQLAASSQVRWQPLWSRRACRQPGRVERFESAGDTYQIKEGFRVYWYRSSEKRLHDAQDRQERLTTALQRLERLNERRGRGPKTEPAIRRAAENILARYRVPKLVRYEIQTVEQARFVQCTPGPATHQTRYRRLLKAIPVLSACPDPVALAAAQSMDGVFPYVTNTTLSALEVLKKYKYQPCLEKRHFLGKSVLEMAPVFLKKNTRIEAFMFVCFIAQLIAALIERTIRQNMARRNLKAIALLPEGRYSKTPTLSQILETFATRAKRDLYEKNQWLKTFTKPLTDLQKTVLDLLEIDAAVYN